MIKKKTLKQLNRPSLEEYKHLNKLPVVIILDNIRSMLNVGAIFRLADAFAIDKIFLCGITPCPPHRQIYRTALGAENSVEWEYKEDIVGALTELKKDEYLLVALEQTLESTSLGNYTFEKNLKYGIILGNEVKGISQDALNICDFAIEIEQKGTKHSLNVSTSLAICIWEISKNLE